jgi:hypothetical protein
MLQKCNREIKVNSMWFFIALALSLIVPDNGVFISLFHGIFGRFYIIYFFVVYYDIFFDFLKSIAGRIS